MSSWKYDSRFVVPSMGRGAIRKTQYAKINNTLKKINAAEVAELHSLSSTQLVLKSDLE